MSWRIQTRHRSEYQYEKAVIASFNEARITPRATLRQMVIESSVTIDPPTPVYTYLDYWSTIVTVFDVDVPHTNLVVTGSSIAETSEPQYGDLSIGWDEIRLPEIANRHAELLLITPYTAMNDQLSMVADEFAMLNSPRAAVDAISAWTREAMTYQAGTTKVSTSALEAWHQASGVCQDFAHLNLALLRTLGIPARYISGYLHPQEDSAIGTTVHGASHAWVEAWLGSWYAYDPTNGSPVGERHVTVGHGRDYADVAPFRGIYHGGALQNLDVSVELTRLA